VRSAPPSLAFVARTAQALPSMVMNITAPRQAAHPGQHPPEGRIQPRFRIESSGTPREGFMRWDRMLEFKEASEKHASFVPSPKAAHLGAVLSPKHEHRTKAHDQQFARFRDAHVSRGSVNLSRREKDVHAGNGSSKKGCSRPKNPFFPENRKTPQIQSDPKPQFPCCGRRARTFFQFGCKTPV